MKLPVAIDYNGKRYTEVELKRPTTSAVANAEAAMKKNPYLGMRSLIGDCLVSISGDETIDKKENLLAMASEIPYKSAEFIMVQIGVLVRKDGAVAGRYKCPQSGCDGYHVAEKDEEVGVDTRDFIEDLELIEYDGNGFVDITLDEPFTVSNKLDKEDQLDVLSLSIRLPLLKHAIEAYAQKGGKNQILLQDLILSKCLHSVSGNEFDDRERRNFGEYIMNRIDISDKIKIVRSIHKYGINPDVKRSCSECGNSWTEAIDVRGFFVEALGG